MAARSFKTEKGTELPLLNLKGKQYLEVKYRLVWFREEHPDWSIETELLSVTDTAAHARAVVRDENGRVMATSHKFESVHGFPDYLEKAETGAIGRALALVGYGTQFCADDLDDGKTVKALREKGAEVSDVAHANQERRGDEAEQETPGEYTINFGRKFKGKRIKDVSRADIESYVKWLESSTLRPGTAFTQEVATLKSQLQKYYNVQSAH